MVPTPEVHLRKAGDGNEIAWWIGLSYSVIRRTIASSATSPTDRRTGSGIVICYPLPVHSHARGPVPRGERTRVTSRIGHRCRARWVPSDRITVVSLVGTTRMVAYKVSPCVVNRISDLVNPSRLVSLNDHPTTSVGPSPNTFHGRVPELASPFTASHAPR